MKATVKRIILFALITSLLILPGCKKEPEEKAPSNYAQLHGLLGKPIAEVCQTLGLDEAQVELALTGNAAFPSLGEAQYAGLTWEAYPLFDRNDKVLFGFKYMINYTENPDQAAPIFVDLMASLAQDYGEPKQHNDTLQAYDREPTAKNILAAIWERRGFSADQMWSLNHEITPEIQAYCDRVVENYSSSAGPTQRPIAGVDYMLTFQYGANLDTAGFSLTYQLQARVDYTPSPREERSQAQAQYPNATP
ncbi:MAG: hypothetical protein J6Q53_02960 [Oscillospiraceae bacterium]|nr:hypothetical protein [Oscillospiraceae bacterium]